MPLVSLFFISFMVVTFKLLLDIALARESLKFNNHVLKSVGAEYADRVTLIQIEIIPFL